MTVGIKRDAFLCISLLLFDQPTNKEVISLVSKRLGFTGSGWEEMLFRITSAETTVGSEINFLA
jgi:hypothetical protein